MNKSLLYPALVLLVVAVDQSTKLMAHFLMTPGTEIRLLGNLLKLHYLTNPGMAFGITLGGSYGKLMLTLLRTIIIVGLGYYLYQKIRQRAAVTFLVCLSLILGGAVGNLIDGLFYGAWLQNAPPKAPIPWGYGQVIDMIYIHIWEGQIPTHWPFLGGQYLSLWPIFNLADASIFVSVIVLALHLHTGKNKMPQLVDEPEKKRTNPQASQDDE